MQGRSVRFAAVDAPDDGAQRRAVRWLLAIERRLYGAASALFAPVRLTTATAGPAADVTIVLAGQAPRAGRVLRPLFDGAPGEDAMLAALLDGRAPLVTIEGGSGDATVEVAAGLPALEDRHVLARSLDHVLSRLITLVMHAIEGRSCLRLDEKPACLPRRGSASRLLARGITERLRGRFGRLRGHVPHWRIAYRFSDATVAQARAWPTTPHRMLPTKRHRFHADPFAVCDDDRWYIFFEEYRSDVRKGVIALVEIDATGGASLPRLVLDHPVHLSYPLVLRHRGAIYMLPEMSALRRLQLFRADPFPDRWVEDRVLLDGVTVADATPVVHDGVWWIFATISDDGGSSWDQLALFHAPDLLGPWTPHASNPVLIDAGSARPAGAMWHENGALMRVAQDCRTGYGRGIAICRVDRLDVDGFAQTVVARLGPPDQLGARGVHTLNHDGALEVFDLGYR